MLKLFYLEQMSHFYYTRFLASHTVAFIAVLRLSICPDRPRVKLRADATQLYLRSDNSPFLLRLVIGPHLTHLALREDAASHSDRRNHMCVPYDGREFTFHNPDQTVIRVRGWGDQNAAVFETLDGYTVVKDRVSGFYHYATVSSDGFDLVSTGIPVGGVAAPDALGVPKGVRMPNSTTPAKLQAAGGIVGEQLRRWQVRRESKRSLMQQMASATDGNIAPAPPPAGTTGTYVGLCLLVQFPDVPGTITQAQGGCIL